MRCRPREHAHSDLNLTELTDVTTITGSRANDNCSRASLPGSDDRLALHDSLLSETSRKAFIIPTRLDEVDGQPGLIVVEHQANRTWVPEQQETILADGRLISPAINGPVASYVRPTGRWVLNLGELRGYEYQKPSSILTIALDGDGYVGSYAQLLVLQKLSVEIRNAELEKSDSTLLGACADKYIRISDYFDDIMGIGTGG